MARFRHSFYKLAPSWLTTEEGEKVRYSLNLVVDTCAERAYQGVYARFPAHAPEDALIYMSRDRKIIRGIDEPSASFRERLITWLDDHVTRGNAWSRMDQIAAYCNAAVVIRHVDRRGNWCTRAADGTRSYTLDSGNWDWDSQAASPNWGRSWVIIYPTAAGDPWEAGPDWGDVDLWGGAWGTPGYTWGSTATPGQVAAIRTIVREWRCGGTRCENVIIAFDSGSFDPAAPEPDGDWDYWGVGDPVVQNRLNTARYWDGSSI